jgi:hypothetical protein
MPVDPGELREAGRRAAELAWQAADETPIALEDPLRPEFATAALDRLEQLQRDAPGVMTRILEGSDRGAEGLNADPLAEVIQNADDAAAREVRIAVVESPRPTLLMAHAGGERVEVDHVLPMSFAFLSTKRSSAEATGKFGVGLQTLKTLGSRLEIHCPPYHFAVEGSQVRRVQSRRSIAGVYAPSKFDTMLALQLNAGVDLEALRGWVSCWGADSMLFLHNVRRIAAIDPAKPKRARSVLELRTVLEKERTLWIRGGEIKSQVAQLRDPATKQQFTRFVAQVPVPKGVQPRSNKETSRSTPAGFALGGGRGRFFAGLPLRLAPSLPWCVHGQLDTELSRNSLKHSHWNEWVLKRLADVISTVIVDLFAETPAAAWAAVPLDEELGEQPDPWLQSRVRDLFDNVRSNVARRARIEHGGRKLGLADIAFEDEQLTGLLTAEEAKRLSQGGTLLPAGLRDPGGRWREVLEQLDISTRLGPDDVRPILSWSDSDLAHRDGLWFSRLTAVLLAADPDATWNDHCLVLGDGRRASPSGIHDEGRLLVRDASSAGLAQRLGLVVGLHSEYLGRSEASRAVQHWLSEAKLLVPAPSSRDALGALARFPKDAPKRLEDDELRTLRQAVEELEDSEHRADLLREIGRRVTVEAAHYKDAKATKEWVQISRVYLPAAFEGRASTWSRASGRVAGLYWMDRRYAKALQLPKERGPAGARDFLVALGAEVAPRLQPRQATTFNRETVQDFNSYGTPEFQARAAEERGHIRFVRGDSTSIAVRAVVRDIARAQQPDRRRRGMALLKTLHESWDRLYAEHATIRAFEADRTLFARGRIPATWIADAASVAWMDNELSDPCLPCDLVVRTPEYLAAIGDEPAVFARDLDQRQAGWPVLQALGVDARPRAKHLVEQLVELQRRDLTEPLESNLEHARVIYLALSSMCPPRGTPEPDVMIDDLSVRGLRRRFAATQQRPGLIRTSTGWYAPADEVFAGRALFGSRRPFVTASSAAAPLWRALRIDAPSVEACVRVLKEIARDSTGAKERAVLADTYRYVSGQMRGGARRPAALQKLPLWTGSSWVTKRPIFALDDRELVQVLGTSGRSPIWQAPGALGPLESFMQAARITKINENTIHLTAATRRRAFAHAFLQERFELATLHLRAALAEEDEVAHDALVADWDEFHTAALRLAQPLEVELRLGRSKATKVARRAQLDIPSLTLYVTEQLDLGDENAAGYAVATLFPTADQRNVALRWTAAWRRAERGEEPDVMRLAPRQQEDIRQLLEQMEASAKSPKVPLKPRKRPTRTHEVADPEIPKLKSPEDLTHGVEVAIVGPDASGEAIQRRGLRKGKAASASKRSFEPRTPKRISDAWDPEDIAIEAVRQALWQIDEREMEDVSRLRGLGADGLRNDEFIEVKHNRRGLPISISLDANEFDRARTEHHKFVLAIAYDLDTDLRTKVRFYVDPLAVLPKLPPTSIVLGGFKSTPTLEVTFNIDDAPK